MNNPFVPSSALIARNGINRRIVRGPKRSQRLVSKSPYTRRPLQKRVIQCFDALSSRVCMCVAYSPCSYLSVYEKEVPSPRLVLVHVTEYNWPYTKPLLANFLPFFQRRLKNFASTFPFSIVFTGVLICEMNSWWSRRLTRPTLVNRASPETV